MRTSHLDSSHGYGNGANLFFYVDGRKDEPQELRFALPRGWKVSIALPARGGAFRAADYDELVDSPFECGTHRTFEFAVRGVPHIARALGRRQRGPGAPREGPQEARDRGRGVSSAACRTSDTCSSSTCRRGHAGGSSIARPSRWRSIRMRSGPKSPTATPCSSSRTSCSTPGTSSASGPRPSARSTTGARSTRWTSGRSRASRPTTRLCSSCAPASSPRRRPSRSG